MNIKILQMLEGAKNASGVAVIIDVFRAFSVECYLLAGGASKIIPVDDSRVAYKLKKEHPDYILIGERHGVMLPGFDYGNSPSSFENVDFTGKTIVHTTSAGTQGLYASKNADVILTGSLVNASSIAKYIKDNNYKDVSLVCMGLEGKNETDEDTLCAEYIKSILEGNKLDLKDKIENLKETSGKKFFDKSLNDVFPERDFYLCTMVDKFNFVLKFEKDNNDEVYYIKKVEY